MQAGMRNDCGCIFLSLESSASCARARHSGGVESSGGGVCFLVYMCLLREEKVPFRHREESLQ